MQCLSGFNNDKASKSIPMIKVLSLTKWGKHKGDIALNIPIASITNTINSTNHNNTHRTLDINTQHLHDKTMIPLLHTYLNLNASQISHIPLHLTHTHSTLLQSMQHSRKKCIQNTADFETRYIFTCHKNKKWDIFVRWSYQTRVCKITYYKIT